MAGLTPAGVLHSWFLGTSVYAAFGWGAYILVCLYFLLGSAVSMPHVVHACLSPCTAASCTTAAHQDWQCIKAPVQCVGSACSALGTASQPVHTWFCPWGMADVVVWTGHQGQAQAEAGRGYRGGSLRAAPASTLRLCQGPGGGPGQGTKAGHTLATCRAGAVGDQLDPGQGHPQVPGDHRRAGQRHQHA